MVQPLWFSIILLIVFLIAGCTAILDQQLVAYHPQKPRVYGESSLPVTVIVQSGFMRPGTYHLPEWATLKTLLEKAQLADVVLKVGLPQQKCTLEVSHIQNGKKVVWKSQGLPTEAELQKPLKDNTVITIRDLVKWHL